MGGAFHTLQPNLKVTQLKDPVTIKAYGLHECATMKSDCDFKSGALIGIYMIC